MRDSMALQTHQKEKRTLSGISRLVAGIASCVAASIPRFLVSECWTDLPFGKRVGNCGRASPGSTAPFPCHKPLGLALGPTDPCTIAVHTETFSNSVLKVLV